MRSYWIKVDSKPNHWSLYKITHIPYEDVVTDTQGRRPSEDEGRDWSEASTSQGVPRLPRK